MRKFVINAFPVFRVECRRETGWPAVEAPFVWAWQIIMDKERRIIELKEQIARAFLDVPHPGSPKRIYAVPCCPDHDALAEWLSLHTWQDLEVVLETEDMDLTAYGDLFPEAYHYFLQAVLIYIIQNVDRDPDSDSWGTKSWKPLDRLYHTIAPWPRSEEIWSQELRSDYLPIFSREQRKIVVCVLEFVLAFGFIPDDEKEYRNLDLQTAIKDIWEVEN
jgi:hypothetical protein